MNRLTMVPGYLISEDIPNSTVPRVNGVNVNSH